MLQLTRCAIVVLVFLAAGGCRRSAKPAAPSHEGHLERVSNTEIVGWAWERAKPDAPVEVELLDDNVPIAVVKADGYRVDLAKAGLGNGKHKFRHAVPARLKDGKPHFITARIVGTKIALQNGPQVLLVPSTNAPYPESHPCRQPSSAAHSPTNRSTAATRGAG